MGQKNLNIDLYEPPKYRAEFTCSGKVSSFCTINATHRVNYFKRQEYLRGKLRWTPVYVDIYK